MPANARVGIPLLVISCPINQERRASNGDFDYTNEMDVFCYVRAEVRQNGATIRFDATREEKKTIWKYKLWKKKYMDSIAQEKKNRNTIDEGEAGRLKILISLEMEIKTELKKKDCNWAQLRDFS